MNVTGFVSRWSRITTWQAIGAVVAAELLVLGWMVWDRVGLLRNGREIVLDVIPVDPRSLFRGDYVILNYEVSRFDGARLEGEPVKAQPLYVTLARDATGKWQVAKAAPAMPKAVAESEIVLKGRTDRWTGRGRAGAPIHVRYGIESFFVPEGTGKVLEQQVGEKRIRAVVAVGRDGTAALKGLEVDGRRVHSEPAL